MENQISQIPTQGIDINTDVTTWALPEGAVARLGRGWVPDIAFSSDERYLAVGTWVGLWLYDLEMLSPVALWETKRGMVGCVTFSPNGKWVAVGNSDQVLKVLDIQKGACLTQVETDDYITGLTFSPDNRYLAAAYASSYTVDIWHAETGEPFAKFTAMEKHSVQGTVILEVLCYGTLQVIARSVSTLNHAVRPMPFL
jgi:WD40 repeat protein